MTTRNWFRALCVVPLLAALAACTSSSSSSSATTNPIQSAIATNAGEANYTSLTCSPGWESVDLPIGQTANRDGETMSLAEKSEATDSSQQVWAQLVIKTNAIDSVPVIIIHAIYGSQTSFTGSEDDRWLNVQISPGGQASYTLDTADYTDYPSLGDRITGVTLCEARAQAPASPTSTTSPSK